VVVERRLFPAKGVARPSAGVEEGQEPRGARLQPRRQLSCASVLRKQRVLAHGESGLELRVQHRERVEAVQPDPRPSGGRQQQAGWEGEVGAASLDEEAAARERLRGDRLRHARAPRRGPAVEAKVVLPDERLTGGNRAGEQREGQPVCLRVSPSDDLGVQLAEAAEGMELQAPACECPVDDPVDIANVGPRFRQRRVPEVARVHVEHGEERERPRLGVASGLRGDVAEHRSEILCPVARQAPEHRERAGDGGAVALGVQGGDVPGGHCGREPAPRSRSVVVPARVRGRHDREGHKERGEQRPAHEHALA